MVHGGGFYRARKYKVAPPDLPERLHWFKWEAYSTWLSGISLLILVYYFGASIYMLPPGSPLSPIEAIVIGVAAIGGSWVLYDLLCHLPFGRDDRVLAVVVALLIAGLAYALTHLLSGRAAFIHVGAAMGTIMVANVFFVIIPEPARGGGPDAAWRNAGPRPGQGEQAAQRAQYLFHPAGAVPDDLKPLCHGHRASVELGAVAGHRGRRRGGAPGLRAAPFGPGARLDAANGRGCRLPHPVVAAATIFRDAGAPAPEQTAATEPAPAATEAVPFAAVQAIVQARCLACHGAKPTFTGIDTPPKGVILETDAQIRQWAPQIAVQAIKTDAMPLGNVTGMQPEERALLGLWLRHRGQGM